MDQDMDYMMPQQQKHQMRAAHPAAAHPAAMHPAAAAPMMMPMESSWSWSWVLKRVVKYLIEGLVIALAARYIPSQELKLREIVMLAVTAAATFIILDLYSPTVATGARLGAGLGIGAGVLGYKLPLASALAVA